MRNFSAIVALVILSWLIAAPWAWGVAVFRSFDGPELVWQRADEQAGGQVLGHSCALDEVRQGSASERLVVQAAAGDAMHFVCPVGRLPVLDEVAARLWVKSTQPGTALAARIVLPRTGGTDRPAKTLLLIGPRCAATDRWEQAQLANVPELLELQVRVLRAVARESIDARGAYIDAMVLVIPGGLEKTTVWTDALEVEGVVMPAVAQSEPAHRVVPAAMTGTPLGAVAVAPKPTPSGAAGPPVRLQGVTMLLGGRPFLPIGITWNNEPFAFLAERGFNTIWLDRPPTREQSVEATRANVWLICTPPSLEELAQQGLGPSLERVIAWSMGDPFEPCALAEVEPWISRVRTLDPLVTRPILVAPQEDWFPMSRLADGLLAFHPASSSLPRADYAHWLQSLPLLMRPGTPTWAVIPTQPGTRVRQQISTMLPGNPAPPSLLAARQMESLVMSAAVNGCRGVVFTSYSPLNASDEISKRRALLVERLVNRLDLMAPWLTVGKRIGAASSTDAATSAVVLQVERARLLVPETNDNLLNASTPAAFLVPGIPESNDAFLLLPSGLQSLISKRVAGGMRVEVDHNISELLLLTEDPTAITSLRQRGMRSGRRAAQVEFTLATGELRTAAWLAGRMQQNGVSSKSLDQAIGAANGELRTVNGLLAANKFDLAYQRAAFARRLVAAATPLSLTAEQPRALDSVPLQLDEVAILRRPEFERRLAMFRAGENQLSGGDFEDLEQLRRMGWEHVDDSVAGVRTQVALSHLTPQQGQYSLELAAAADAAAAAPQFVARPLVWVDSPPMRVRAGEIVEISGWVRVGAAIVGSIEGMTIRDSLGGPELALRVGVTNGWEPFRLLRTSRETKDIKITFALHGLGRAQVDSVIVRAWAPRRVNRLPAPITNVEPPGPPADEVQLLPPAPLLPDSAQRSLSAPTLPR